MKKLPAFLIGGLAVAVAGAAYAVAPKTHVISVPLPDGSVARVEYVGDVAPKVTVAPPAMPGDFWATGALPQFGSFDRMIEQMNRETAAMMRQVQEMSRQPIGAPGMNVASYGNLPAGANSVSVVTVSNGGSSCTRTTEVVSQGAGKPPKVTSNVSGNCAGATLPAFPATPQPPAHAAPQRAPAALDRT
jgi:hypothetical protein